MVDSQGNTRKLKFSFSYSQVNREELKVKMGRLSECMLNSFHQEVPEQQVHLADDVIVPGLASGVPTSRVGRPELWSPRVLSEADTAHADRLTKRYGPKISYGESTWINKYMSFCEMNQLNPRDLRSAQLCVGQAVQSGLSVGSLCTYFEGMVNKLQIKDGWRLRSTLNAGHADEDPKQPRLVRMNTVELTSMVNSLTGFDRIICWLAFATGARFDNLMRIRFSQLILEDDKLFFERRLTKVHRQRSSRREIAYLFEWSMPPPADVKTFLTEGNPSKLLNAEQPAKYNGNRVSATVTYQLRKLTGTKVTSYVFRDHMEERLQSLDIPDTQREILMDHSIETAEASYGPEQSHPVKAKFLKAARKQSTKKQKKVIKKSKKSRGKN